MQDKQNADTQTIFLIFYLGRPVWEVARELALVYAIYPSLYDVLPNHANKRHHEVLGELVATAVLPLKNFPQIVREDLQVAINVLLGHVLADFLVDFEQVLVDQLVCAACRRSA